MTTTLEPVPVRNRGNYMGMTVKERVELARLEAVIEKGKQTFIEVGLALMTIRDSRLYRDRFSSFDDYCRERWDFGRRHASQLIEAFGLAAECEAAGLPVPENEHQARDILTERKRQEKTLGGSSTKGLRDNTKRTTEQAAATARAIEAVKWQKTAVLVGKLRALHADHPRAHRASETLDIYLNIIKNPNA